MKKRTHKNNPTPSNPKGQKDREISRLRRELTAERRHTAKLEREISDLRRALKAHETADTRRSLRHKQQAPKEALLLSQANQRAHHYRKGSFLRYLWESIMESAPVQLLSKLIQYLRRIRAIQLILTILLTLAAVVTVAVVSAAVLPFLFFGTALLAMLALMRSRRMNRILRKELTDRRIRIMIPPRGTAFLPDSFFLRNANAMASEIGVTVIVVTPYLMSNRGLRRKGSFFTAHKEIDNLYFVRRHYFFILRRRVLDTLDSDITVIY